MRRKLFALAVALAGVPAAATAGPYSDDLGQCMIGRMTEADRTTLVRWIVLAFASHPAISDAVTVDPAAAAPIQAAMGGMVERLLVEDCLEPARQAVKFEGQAAIGSAFELVGAIAGREASAAPEVAGIMQGFVGELNLPRIEQALTGN